GHDTDLRRTTGFAAVPAGRVASIPAAQFAFADANASDGCTATASPSQPTTPTAASNTSAKAMRRRLPDAINRAGHPTGGTATKIRLTSTSLSSAGPLEAGVPAQTLRRVR